MSFFDNVLDLANSQINQTANPLASLGNEAKMAMMQKALQLFNDPQQGGIQGLLNGLQQAGLGDIVNSWLAQGNNLPVSAEQLVQAIGDSHLAPLAEAAGLSQSDIANPLAKILPKMIDHLSPDGQLPANGAINPMELFQHFAAAFMPGAQ